MTTSPPSRNGSHATGGDIRPKVVYVMGSGRCGSTILGVTLGNCEDMFFVGELDRWLPSDGAPVLGGLERTRFWRDVRDRVEVPRDLIGSHARDSLERALGPLRARSWRGRRELRKRYRRAMAEIYRAISTVSGAGQIVETSHFPLRAKELKGVEEIDVYLIFLVRHPQSVMGSFVRMVNSKDVLAVRKRELSTNADLWLTHLQSIYVFLRHRADRRLFVRYEDFTADPQGVLRQVLDMAQSQAAIPDLSELRTGFPMGGNRLLRSEVVALKPETPKPERPYALTALLQAPLEPLLSRLRPVARRAR